MAAMVLPHVCAAIPWLSSWWNGKGRLKLEIMVSATFYYRLFIFNAV